MNSQTFTQPCYTPTELLVNPWTAGIVTTGILTIGLGAYLLLGKLIKKFTFEDKRQRMVVITDNVTIGNMKHPSAQKKDGYKPVPSGDRKRLTPQKTA